MQFLVNALVTLVALLHFWFLILEMFLWQKPLGLKTFRNTPEKAQITAVLAANQGLYNGFLATGLLVSLFFSNPEMASAFQAFFLSCVAVAGTYGGWSVSRKVFWIQAFPAIVGLMVMMNTHS